MQQTIGTDKDYEQFLEEQKQSITHIKYGDKIELFRRHQLCLSAYEKQLTYMGGLKKLSGQYKYDMDQIKKKHMYAITKEQDGSGALKFRNEAARSSELANRLNNNPDYQKLLDMSEDIEDQLIDGEAKVTHIKTNLKFYEVWA
jgi:hypothetical protein